MVFFTKEGRKHAVSSLSSSLLISAGLLACFSACSFHSKTAANSPNAVVLKNALDAETEEEAIAAAKEREMKSQASRGGVQTQKSSNRNSARMPASQARATQAQHYAVQIGAFKVKENAEKMVQELQHKGFATELRQIDHSKHGHLFLVQLTPVAQKNEADRLAVELSQKAGIHPQLISLP